MTKPNLTKLPPEILEHIFAQIETAQALSCLSQTCNDLHAYIEKHGYRIFVQHRFPTVKIPTAAIPQTKEDTCALPNKPIFWKDAAHGLTTLSRNWDRRAFIAQAIQDPHAKGSDAAVEVARRRRQRGPTIGFIPVLDSYEAWYQPGWTSRKEVVAWGAGARLVMRTMTMGPMAVEDGAGERSNRALKPHWRKYIKKGALEGIDDITTLNLFPGELDKFEELLLGRASGSLELLRLDKNSANKTLATYNTGGKAVRYAALPCPATSIAAICLGDQDVALYPINVEGRDIEPCASASIQKPHEKSRTWSMRFLNKRRLAVGLGRSTQPIKIYNLGDGDLKLDRVTHLALNEGSTASCLEGPNLKSAATSIYSLAPLSQSSTSSGTEGGVFLSGGYDAYVRLHDLRLSSTVVSLFSDPVDAYAAVYSLLPIGGERFVAGGAMHALLKVFDLRMPGQKLYDATQILPLSDQKSLASGEEGFLRSKNSQSNMYGNGKGFSFHKHPQTPRNWNVFLGSRNRGHLGYLESPVYALTRPSSVSPTIYAGIQNCIMQLDMVSVLDQYPDTIYGSNAQSIKSMDEECPTWKATPTALSKTQQSRTDAAVRKWDPNQEVLNLPMYDQADQVILKHQKPIRATYLQRDREYKFRGLDERWGGGSVKEGYARGNVTGWEL